MRNHHPKFNGAKKPEKNRRNLRIARAEERRFLKISDPTEYARRVAASRDRYLMNKGASI